MIPTNKESISAYEKVIIAGFKKQDFFDYSSIQMFMEQVAGEHFEDFDDVEEQAEFVEDFLSTRKRFLIDNFVKPHLINICVKDAENLKALNDFVLINLEF